MPLHLPALLATFIVILLSALCPPTHAQDADESLPETARPVPNADSVNGWWMKRHNAKVAEAAERGEAIQLIFLGDSITQGWQGAGKPVWQEHHEKHGAMNLGFSADRTERVLWRLKHDEIKGLAPRVVVLMIGTNNTHHRKHTPREVTLGVQAILDELAKQMPDTRVLLLGIFPRGESPDNALRKSNDATNALLAKLNDDQRVFYRNINSVFLHDDGSLRTNLFRDGVHPNKQGYATWAQAIAPFLDKHLAEPNAE